MVRRVYRQRIRVYAISDVNPYYSCISGEGGIRIAGLRNFLRNKEFRHKPVVANDLVAVHGEPPTITDSQDWSPRLTH
jgi:hypothetical protein